MIDTQVPVSQVTFDFQQHGDEVWLTQGPLGGRVGAVCDWACDTGWCMSRQFGKNFVGSSLITWPAAGNKGCVFPFSGDMTLPQNPSTELSFL